MICRSPVVIRRGRGDCTHRIDANMQVLAESMERFAATNFRCPDCGSIQALADTGKTFDDIWCYKKGIIHRTEVKAIRRRGRWDKKHQKLIPDICKSEPWSVKLGSKNGFYNFCLTSGVNLLLLWYDYSTYPGHDPDETNNTLGIYDQTFEYALLLRSSQIVKYQKMGDKSPIRFMEKDKKIVMHVLPEAFSAFQEVFPEQSRRSQTKRQREFQREVDAATSLHRLSEASHTLSAQKAKKKRKCDARLKKKLTRMLRRKQIHNALVPKC